MTLHPEQPEAAHLRAASLAPAARDWLVSTTFARVLHIFEKACNLVNEAGDVLSLVQHKLGDGPFAVRLHDGPPIDFTEWVSIGSDIIVSSRHVQSGALHIDLSQAERWSPVPDWLWMSHHPDRWLGQLPLIQQTLLRHAPPGSLALYFTPPSSMTDDLSTLQHGVLTIARPLINALLSGIVEDAADRYADAAAKLAGLGGGLTPAGDDFLLGVMYGLWAAQPSSIATVGQSLVGVAVPRTTRLSGAWLKAGQHGEAGTLWHQFVYALKSGDQPGLVQSIERISAVGHTSGSDALAGFVALIQARTNSG